MSATAATRRSGAGRGAVERLNPVTRLLLAVLVCLPVLVSLDWLSATVMLVGLLVVLRAAGARPAAMLVRLAPVAVAAALAAVTMALYGKPGGRVYWQWWLVEVTRRSVTMAGAVVLRVLVLGALAGMRMLSLFVEDWRTLGRARRARGLGDTGRLRRWTTMAFALLVLAIRRGTKLATAMEARGFDAQHARQRTWARPSRLGAPDVIGLTAAAALDALALVVSILAGTFAPVTS